METTYKIKLIPESTYINPEHRGIKFLPKAGTTWCHNAENCLLNNKCFENLGTYIKVSFIDSLTSWCQLLCCSEEKLQNFQNIREGKITNIFEGTLFVFLERPIILSFTLSVSHHI
jgi:hypothetical protein